MKMINDMDMYYANAYARADRPMWMKDERIDYCSKVSDHKNSFFHTLFHKKAK